MTTEADAPATSPDETPTPPSNLPVVAERERPAPVATRDSASAFGSLAQFADAQRIAKALASSSMVPNEYRGENNIANCLVAMELAHRTGASVLAVMQNLHIINGRPSWASSFLIGSINTSGHFSKLRYETRGDLTDPQDKKYAMRAYATERSSGQTLYGEWITWHMVENEGWSTKGGSKWRTMPGQMFRYRAAAFWARAYAPEISLGMHSDDELEDIVPAPIAPAAAVVTASMTGADRLRAATATATVEPEAAAPEKAPPPKKDPAQESNDAYVARMKLLQMRKKEGKRLTQAEVDELVKYEALHE